MSRIDDKHVQYSELSKSKACESRQQVRLKPSFFFISAFCTFFQIKTERANQALATKKEASINKSLIVPKYLRINQIKK